MILCARPVTLTPRSDAFHHLALNLSFSIVFFLVISCYSPHEMDPSDHDSDKTTDDEHDVQPSDLEELAVVVFSSWSSGKLDNSELYSIHGIKSHLVLFSPFFFVTERCAFALMKYLPRKGNVNIIRGGRNLVESNEGGVVGAVLEVLKLVQEGFRKVAHGKAMRMEVRRLRSCQGDDITKAWQHLLNAIAEALPGLKDDCHGNEAIFTVDHHETLHTAKYGIDDFYSTMGYCVEVGPDSRIMSRSTQLMD